MESRTARQDGRYVAHRPGLGLYDLGFRGCKTIPPSSVAAACNSSRRELVPDTTFGGRTTAQWRATVMLVRTYPSEYCRARSAFDTSVSFLSYGKTLQALPSEESSTRPWCARSATRFRAFRHSRRSLGIPFRFKGGPPGDGRSIPWPCYMGGTQWRVLGYRLFASSSSSCVTHSGGSTCAWVARHYRPKRRCC